MRLLAPLCLIAALLTASACDRQDVTQTQADIHKDAADTKASVDTVAHDPTVKKIGAEAKKLGHETGVAINKGVDNAHDAGSKVSADVHRDTKS